MFNVKITLKLGFLVFLFLPKGFHSCSKCVLHVNTRFTFQSLLAVIKKGLGKDQRGHFIPSTIRWVWHSRNRTFPREVCSAGCYRFPAQELPGLCRRGQETQWANQTTCKILCDGACLPGFTRKGWLIMGQSFYRVQSDFTSLKLFDWRYVLSLSSCEEK